MSVFNPTCPTDCTNTLPALDFNYCAPENIFGEIQKIYIAPGDATAFIDVEDLAEWTARLSNITLGDINIIRWMDVIASKDAPEYTELELSLDRKRLSYKTHKISFKADDVSQSNYDFMRQLECGGYFKIWYSVSGGKMFGGNDGILASITADFIIPETNDELATIQGMIEWKSKFSPEMTDDPMNT